jgi:hypothetical protein
MTSIRAGIGLLLNQCDTLFDRHARAELPKDFGPYAFGAWWSRVTSALWGRGSGAATSQRRRS